MAIVSLNLSMQQKHARKLFINGKYNKGCQSFNILKFFGSVRQLLVQHKYKYLLYLTWNAQFTLFHCKVSLVFKLLVCHDLLRRLKDPQKSKASYNVNIRGPDTVERWQLLPCTIWSNCNNIFHCTVVFVVIS